MSARMAREIKLLTTEPPPGVCAWPNNDRYDELSAQIQGPKGSVYEKGVFTLSVHIPPRYPFEPPQLRFITPVYHPNIDDGGRICLDILNMPPKGAWRPALNISTVLASIGLLLADPNPEDGLMTEVAAEYKLNRAAFDMKARQMVERHAAAKESTAPESSGRNAEQNSPPAASASATTEPTEPISAPPGPSNEQMSTTANADSDTCACEPSAQHEGAGAASGAQENSNSCVNQQMSNKAGQAGKKAAGGAPSNRLSLKKRMRVS
ncbi:Ubiquitin-conjugating enzyme E2 T [Coccomyxa sp. Obi]|nr:Ubiquitin-conjugating enzyme E2 T [Coccomyxa sp. Obi]